MRVGIHAEGQRILLAVKSAQDSDVILRPTGNRLIRATGQHIGAGHLAYHGPRKGQVHRAITCCRYRAGPGSHNGRGWSRY